MRPNLVSIVIPIRTRNIELERTLSSLDKQTYTEKEILIIDKPKSETRDTRNYQRNKGINLSNGEYVLVTDGDFVFQNTLIQHCVEKSKQGFDAITYFGTSEITNQWRRFPRLIPDWSKIRKIERDSYFMNKDYSAPAFFRKAILSYLSPPVYNENINAGEEFDLKRRILERGFKIGYIEDYAIHIGEPKSLSEMVLKYILYGESIPTTAITNPFRFKSWIANKKDFADIRVAYGFPIYKYVQYTSAIIGRIKHEIQK